MLVKDKAFILKTTRYGDADLIVHALSASGAKLSLFARSAVKSKKRFGGGVLEPTHYVQLLYRDKTSSSNEQTLHTLNEASLLNGFDRLRTDYGRLQAALQMVHFISDIAREGSDDTGELFNLLGNALHAAETTTALDKLVIHFEVKLLTLQGVLPHAEHESLIMHAPIAEHDSLELTDQEWKSVELRTERVMRDYLGKPDLRDQKA